MMRWKIFMLFLIIFFHSKGLLAKSSAENTLSESNRNYIAFAVSLGYVNAQYQFEKGEKNVGFNLEASLPISKNHSFRIGTFFFQYKPTLKDYVGSKYFKDFAAGISLKKNFLNNNVISPFIQMDLGFGQYEFGERERINRWTNNYLDFFVNGGFDFFSSSNINLKMNMKAHISNVWAIFPKLHSIGFFLGVQYKLKI